MSGFISSVSTEAQLNSEIHFVEVTTTSVYPLTTNITEGNPTPPAVDGVSQQLDPDAITIGHAAEESPNHRTRNVTRGRIAEMPRRSMPIASRGAIGSEDAQMLKCIGTVTISPFPAAVDASGKRTPQRVIAARQGAVRVERHARLDRKYDPANRRMGSQN